MGTFYYRRSVYTNYTTGVGDFDWLSPLTYYNIE